MTLVGRMCRAKSNSQGFLSSSKEGENLSLKKGNLSLICSKSGFNQLKKIKSKKKNTRETHTKKEREVDSI